MDNVLQDCRHREALTVCMRCNITTFPWYRSWHLSHKLTAWESKSDTGKKRLPYQEGRSWVLKESFKTPLTSCPIPNLHRCISPHFQLFRQFRKVQALSLKIAGFNSRSSNVMNLITDKIENLGLEIMREYLQYSISAFQVLHLQSTLLSTPRTWNRVGNCSLLFFSQLKKYKNCSKDLGLKQISRSHKT